MNEKQMDALVGLIQIPGLEIAKIRQSDPLEVQGTLCGNPFHFSAHANRWSLWQEKPGRICRGFYEGEMTALDATLIIQQCARELLSDPTEWPA
jgi:hypothetical protein